MEIRKACPGDYDFIVSVVDDWWGGRDMSKILPRQFLDNFHETSFVIEKEQSIIGILIGYLAPAQPDIGYVHFIGIHPKHRKKGLAKRLYQTFAGEIGWRGGKVIRGITADINKLSQKVHTRLGFSFVGSETIVDGVPIHLNYDGLGRHRVIF